MRVCVSLCVSVCMCVCVRARVSPTRAICDRLLGIVVVRGTSVMLVCPEDGTEEIENPFITAE